MFRRINFKIMAVACFMIVAALADGLVTSVRVSPEVVEEANPLTKWGIEVFGRSAVLLFSFLEVLVGFMLVKKFKNWIAMTVLAWWGYFHWAGFLSWQPEIFNYLLTLGFFGILLSLSLYPLPIMILFTMMIIDVFPIKMKRKHITP
jgi:hypothetical protein